ncbi:MAG: mreC [Chthoniobacteraceae bacterium]|nr:mreC [Chthoniobacteraceae bacterium]MDB6172214.1 mreC [Chthoniobacteraceae bacterium]
MKQRANIIAVTLFAVAVIALFTFVSPRGVQRVQSGFLGIIAPFLKRGSSLERQYTAFREGLKTLNQLEDDNKRLVISNKELSATNQTLRGLEAENSRLRNAIGYQERAVFQLMPAQIIAHDPSSWYNFITIDRGSEEGIKPDMPVLTEEGLVGKTQVVSDHYSTVLLISDENCSVAASVEGTREQGIVSGERTSQISQPVLGLNYLSRQANLKSGQRVNSSGSGGVFPAGVFIGVIKEFKIGPLVGYATIVPAVDLSTIQDVFVVVGNSK